MEKWINKIIEGDCLEVMKLFPPKSIDMVLADLPYGCTHNSWDKTINLDQLWMQYKRIIKPSGVIILTGQGIFTAKLILSNPEMFRYKIVWIKSKATNFLNAQKQPLRKHEDICVFYNGKSVYNPQMVAGRPYDRGTRLGLSDNYNSFKDIRVQSQTGKRFPSDILFFEEESPDDVVYFKTAESEGRTFHSTQKPVALGRYLIRTYSNKDDIVLDNSCGSGSFLVAAILEERKFVGIEKNIAVKNGSDIENIIDACSVRITSAFNERRLINQQTDS